MTSDARAEEVKELLAENEVLSQQLFTARGEIAELREKVDELRALVTLTPSPSKRERILGGF